MKWSNFFVVMAAIITLAVFSFIFYGTVSETKGDSCSVIDYSCNLECLQGDHSKCRCYTLCACWAHRSEKK